MDSASPWRFSEDTIVVGRAVRHRPMTPGSAPLVLTRSGPRERPQARLFPSAGLAPGDGVGAAGAWSKKPSSWGRRTRRHGQGLRLGLRIRSSFRAVARPWSYTNLFASKPAGTAPLRPDLAMSEGHDRRGGAETAKTPTGVRTRARCSVPAARHELGPGPRRSSRRTGGAVTSSESYSTAVLGTRR